MSRTVKEVSMFPPGTPESAIFAIQGLRGSADSEGGSSLGIFYERDY